MALSRPSLFPSPVIIRLFLPFFLSRLSCASFAPLLRLSCTPFTPLSFLSFPSPFLLLSSFPSPFLLSFSSLSLPLPLFPPFFLLSSCLLRPLLPWRAFAKLEHETMACMAFCQGVLCSKAKITALEHSTMPCSPFGSGIPCSNLAGGGMDYGIPLLLIDIVYPVFFCRR